jgi:integrase
VFTREEAETLIADPRIPADRQLVYAFGVLAGLRPGEAAALRWRHWEPSVQPLGKLLVAARYNTRKQRAKGTKTDVVRHVPVHPTLAAMLAEWRLPGGLR